MKTPVERAVELAGGRTKVASVFDVTPEAVRQWGLKKRRVPAEYVLRLEAMSGVSRYELRSDVYGKAA